MKKEEKPVIDQIFDIFESYLLGDLSRNKAKNEISKALNNWKGGVKKNGKRKS